MASYLRSWLLPQSPNVPAPAIVKSSSSVSPSPPGAYLSDDDNDDTETIRGDSPEHDDAPPAFPSMSNVQRLSSAPSPSTITPIPRILTDSERMPPPPSPGLVNARRPGLTPPSASNRNTLGVPSSGNLLSLPPTSSKPPKVSRKVALAPGHGPLDWANLKKSGTNLRGVNSLMRITPSMLKQHNKREDAWSAFHGKVYNITPYLPYHPGGEKELMRVAGRDGTRLFSLTHAWVNVDYMLDECLVGFLVNEP
ncbi:hypothetical protein NM688_g1386 [Phlebia brevispora]|uniref:Uncharacterized protein n=1 Tax=Phlebia brevispora TaxID=194682 RepID=A0ACC1TBH4_9APHY|nr:hypothetical protein NM688_g1386 [Phlebia brevispora]